MQGGRGGGGGSGSVNDRHLHHSHMILLGNANDDCEYRRIISRYLKVSELSGRVEENAIGKSTVRLACNRFPFVSILQFLL